MNRATPRPNKWRDMAAALEPGQVVRLYHVTDARSLCGALRRMGARGSYTRDRFGFKVEKNVVRKTKYPFAKLGVGESFVVPNKSMRSFALRVAKKFGFVATSREQEDGTYRIWRIE